jgi:hypothetical protein
MITLAIGALASLESCRSSHVCGSAKMIGYRDGNDAQKVIRNNR